MCTCDHMSIKKSDNNNNNNNNSFYTMHLLRSKNKIRFELQTCILHKQVEKPIRFSFKKIKFKKIVCSPQGF